VELRELPRAVSLAQRLAKECSVSFEFRCIGTGDRAAPTSRLDRMLDQPVPDIPPGRSLWRD
jgi:hypothetical protein